MSWVFLFMAAFAGFDTLNGREDYNGIYVFAGCTAAAVLLRLAGL